MSSIMTEYSYLPSANIIESCQNKITKEKFVEFEVFIQSLIDKYHNPMLVIKDAAPNGNIIYHLYADFEITYEKGGFAYLQRSRFQEKSPLYTNLNLKLNFPIKYNGISYCIVTQTHALEIYNLVSEFAKNTQMIK